MRRRALTAALAAALILGGVAALPLPVSARSGGPAVAGTPAPGDGPDVSPPIVPGNPRTSFEGRNLTLLWDASSDDRGVIRYELFANGRRFATTTETSLTMPMPPPMLFTFGIQALDAAGNSSPFAIIKLGSLPDSVPPRTPANLRLIRTGDDYYRVSWDPSPDNVFVAGYEVRQRGTVNAVTLVGGTFAYGVSRGYGEYLFEVRAFDSSGNYSTPARIGIAVDPPPPTPPATPAP